MSVVTTTQAAPRRFSSIDVARGLVIVIMAIDHIRDLLHTTSLSQNPVDLATTTPALFFTRWITHFCAPVFVFLAGTSAWLMKQNQNNSAATRRLLLSRGAWLVLMELTIVGFGIWADLRFRTFLLQVIFTIGAGFIILSTLVKVPGKVTGAIGLLIILLHDALPPLRFDSQAAQFSWTLFFERGLFNLGPERAVMVAYPIVPWLGILLLGFGFGRVFELDAASRKRILLWSGASALLLFVLLRGFNLYGDPQPWSRQDSPLFSLLSFLNVTKYPPSLLYTAITLSALFFVLYALEGKHNRITRFFETYGRVPFFFYILHWYIVHASMFVMIILQGVSWEQMPFGVMSFGRPAQGVGLGLGGIYLYWIGLIALLYPLCRWYGHYKAAHRHNKWLVYL